MSEMLLRACAEAAAGVARQGIKRTTRTMIDRNEFLNVCKILRSLDRHELESVGLFAEGQVVAQSTLTPEEAGWIRFRDDPISFLIRASDDTADRIWLAVAVRMPKP